MRAVYAGHEPLTFSDYIDLGTGKTLFAEPGQVYDIIPASGRLVDEVPVPWFVPAARPKAPPKSAPEPAAEQGPAKG